MDEKITKYLTVALLVLFFYGIAWIDDLRGKRKARLNGLGLCARCGKTLGCSNNYMTISGGGRSLGRSGQICNKCADINSLQTIILFFLLAIVFAGTMILCWWNSRA